MELEWKDFKHKKTIMKNGRFTHLKWKREAIEISKCHKNQIFFSTCKIFLYFMKITN